MWRHVQSNKMKRMLRVCFFQQLKCLFIITKRDIDLRYFIGRNILLLCKLIQLIEHFICLVCFFCDFA